MKFLRGICDPAGKCNLDHFPGLNPDQSAAATKEVERLCRVAATLVQPTPSPQPRTSSATIPIEFATDFAKLKRKIDNIDIGIGEIVKSLRKAGPAFNVLAAAQTLEAANGDAEMADGESKEEGWEKMRAELEGAAGMAEKNQGPQRKKGRKDKKGEEAPAMETREGNAAGQ